MSVKELKSQLLEIRVEMILNRDDKKNLIVKEKQILNEIKKQISKDINNESEKQK